MPHHLTDAIALATGANDAPDLVARTEGDPVLAPIARAIAAVCEKIDADDERLTAFAGAVRAVELAFSTHIDGGGDDATLAALGRAARALQEITAVYAARLQSARHLDTLLGLFAAADQRPADA
jgi:hypothetical protein